MALTKDQKSAQVTALLDRMQRAKSLVWVSYRGLSVEEASAFKNKLREVNAEEKVAKKTLFRVAAKEAGYPEVAEEAMEGPVGFVFSFEDEISGAKVAYNFGKENDAVQILGGVLEGKVLSKEDALELAKMLSHEEMLAKFAAMIRAPLSNFASMAGSPLRGLAVGMKELAEKGGTSLDRSSSDASDDSGSADKNDAGSGEASNTEEASPLPDEKNDAASDISSPTPEESVEESNESEPEPKPE